MAQQDKSGSAAGAARTYHHGDLRAALLVAARRALEADGAEAVSFRAIARAAGVSQTAPYNHFENRQALLAALVEQGFVTLAGMQDQAVAGDDDFKARILRSGLAYVAFARRHAQLYRLMFGVGLPDWHERPAVATAKLRSIQPLRDTLAAWGAELGWPQARIDVSALACWSMVHGLAMLRIDRASLHFDAVTPEDAIERASLSMLVDGLAVGLSSGAGRP